MCKDAVTGGRRPSGLWVCTCRSMCLGDESPAIMGSASFPDNPAGQGQWSCCYVSAWSKPPFPAVLFYQCTTWCCQNDSTADICVLPSWALSKQRMLGREKGAMCHAHKSLGGNKAFGERKVTHFQRWLIHKNSWSRDNCGRGSVRKNKKNKKIELPNSNLQVLIFQTFQMYNYPRIWLFQGCMSHILANWNT